MKMTLKLLVLVLTLFILLQMGHSAPKRQLDCDSYLRYVYPEHFTHCDLGAYIYQLPPICSYSEWSEWETVDSSTVDVPTLQCSSGRAYSESRSRSASSPDCTPESETRQVCMPDDTDRFIEALGLGSVYAPAPVPGIPQCANCRPQSNSSTLAKYKRSSLQWCPETVGSKPICTDSAYTNGKRSLSKEYQPVRKPQKRSEPEPLPIDPIPYSRDEHGARFRRQSNAQCSSSDTQFILFLLDTSGSIGRSYFNSMTAAIAKLVPLFCKDIRVAVMTFSSAFRLEFCFNCYGRGELTNAIKVINYRGGGTYTAGASKCACDELLTPQCGLECDAKCIDVVYITDGHSNDPGLEVCEEVKCLHNHVKGINVHSIGIRGYDEAELNCIENSSDSTSVFKYNSFSDFTQAIDEVILKLFMEARNPDSSYECVKMDGSLGEG